MDSRHFVYLIASKECNGYTAMLAAVAIEYVWKPMPESLKGKGLWFYLPWKYSAQNFWKLQALWHCHSARDSMKNIKLKWRRLKNTWNRATSCFVAFAMSKAHWITCSKIFDLLAVFLCPLILKCLYFHLHKETLADCKDLLCHKVLIERLLLRPGKGN